MRNPAGAQRAQDPVPAVPDHEPAAGTAPLELPPGSAAPRRSGAPAPTPVPRPAATASRRQLFDVMVLSFAASLVIALWVLVGLGGWAYYLTPVDQRGYSPLHAMLKPSGSVAHPLGVIGLTMMFMPLLYTARKNWRLLKGVGSLKVWLEVHIFCGIVGPVLVSFHTAFKFNGIVSVAYWAMLAVVLSGFVGRYLYVRIPKTIRGVEMTYEEILRDADRLKARLGASDLPAHVLEHIDRLESGLASSRGRLSAADFLFGRFDTARQLRGLRRTIRKAGVSGAQVAEAVGLIKQRALLLRRLAYLASTKKLFAMWHMFHQPFVYVMVAIALFHTTFVMFLGYIPFWSPR
jgi:hypothetical protein